MKKQKSKYIFLTDSDIDDFSMLIHDVRIEALRFKELTNYYHEMFSDFVQHENTKYIAADLVEMRNEFEKYKKSIPLRISNFLKRMEAYEK